MSFLGKIGGNTLPSFISNAGSVLTMDEMALLKGLRKRQDWTVRQVYSTAGSYSLVIPATVTLIYYKMWGAGAGGGGANTGAGGDGGCGAYEEGYIVTTPNETLTIIVGSKGLKGTGGAGTGGAAGPYGEPGSGSQTATQAGGGSGGGYSGIFRSATPLAMAGGGGGGGGGTNQPSNGQNGAAAGCNGSIPAGAGTTYAAQTGNQSSAGYGAINANGNGVTATTHKGGNAGGSASGGGGGGGGGGGHSGGGGGVNGEITNTRGGSSGAGGTSFPYSTTADTVQKLLANGLTRTALNTSDVDYASNAGAGGTGGPSGTSSGTDGNDGLIVIYY